MPKKRRNNGRRSNKHRGSVSNVNCSKCHSCVRKDKAIRKITIRPLLDYGARHDFEKAQAQGHALTFKTVTHGYYCMSCARHMRVVRASAKNPEELRSTHSLRENDEAHPGQAQKVSVSG